MKKLIIAVFVFSIMFGGIVAYAADCTQDNVIDQVGDWFATLGKQGVEKDKILATRKADRVIACTKREAEKAGADLKNKLGF